MTALPEPPPRRRRWLRRLLFAAATLLALALLAAVLALQNLEAVARFALERVFPGIRVEMGSLRAVSASRVEVRTLTLRSARTREPLLTLDGGSATFRLGDLWRARLEEVRLDQPLLVVSPDLGKALGAAAEKSGPADSSTGGFAWTIGRLILDRGQLRVTRFDEPAPTLDLEVSADLKNFGVGGEAATVEHAVRLSNLRATDRDQARIFEAAFADLRFTTGELFARNRLRSARLGPGRVTVAPRLLDLLAPHPAGPPGGNAAPVRPGWTVGSLDLEGLGVTIPDAPGPLGRVEFRVATALRDLGAGDATAPQIVRVENLRVATEAAPDPPLLTAETATARFTSAGLFARRLDELEITNPVLDLTPPPATTAGAATATTAPPAEPAAFTVGRLATRFGVLRLRGLNGGALDVSTKFSFDLTELATTGEAARRLHELTLWDVQATGARNAPLLSLDVARASFRVADLLARRHLEALSVKGGRLVVGKTLQQLLAANSSTPPAAPAAPVPPAPDSAWSVGTVEIAGIRTRLEDNRPGLTELRFTVGTTLRNVSARGLARGLLDEVQTVELANISLRSPINPDARILSLRSVFLRFTLRDLARRNLREVVILRPSIYLSQDLFVYMERATAADPQTPAAPAGSSAESAWSVDRLEVKFGRLVLGSGGRDDIGLPLEFETTARDLALDNLAKLQLTAALRVPRQSYDFPDYQLEVQDVEGDLRFAYPPEKGEKNLVQKLEIAGVRWRQYRAREAWVAVTFDARGINGQFGGAAYRGYVNGGFSFFFQDDSPWIGWVAGTGVDTEKLTGVISPQNFRLTGPADFEIQLDAFRKRIARLRGVFRLTEPGRLRIGKLDDLLANIPPTWNLLKQSSTRVALETLRDFDYTKAGGEFWFVDSQGLLNLDLSGPHGSRTFEVAVHDDTDSPNLWQQGKLGRK